MRHIKRLLALALTYCLVADPAWAVWSVANLRSSGNPWNHCATCHTITFTTNVVVPANALIILFFNARGTNASTETFSGGDGGDTFTSKPCVGTTNTNFSGVLYAVSAGGLASGATITFSLVSGLNATDIQFTGAYATGGLTSSPEDTSVAACNSGTATISPTVTSGTPSQSGDLIVSSYANFATGFTFIEDATWTATFSASDSNAGVAGAYINNAGSGTKTRSPVSDSTAYAMNTVGFKLAGVAPASHSLMFQSVP